jgi:general secretion pathway protein C
MILTPRQQRLTSNILCGVIVASVGVALAGLTWRLAGFAGSAAPQIVPVASPAAGPVAVDAAIALAPFGRASAADAPATTLPLELRGIVLAEPRAASTALIAPTGGKPLPYAVGAAVGGATIREILIDRVTLDVGGQMQTLAFPKATAPATPPPATGGTGPSDAPPPMQLLAPAAGAAPAAAAAAPAAGLAQRFGATPTGDGYRIGTPPADAATKAGLQSGDVIRSVNGQPLGDPARDAATLAAAQAAGTARIEVVRGGQRVTLSMPLPR